MPLPSLSVLPRTDTSTHSPVRLVAHGHSTVIESAFLDKVCNVEYLVYTCNNIVSIKETLN